MRIVAKESSELLGVQGLGISERCTDLDVFRQDELLLRALLLAILPVHFIPLLGPRFALLLLVFRFQCYFQSVQLLLPRDRIQCFSTVDKKGLELILNCLHRRHGATDLFTWLRFHFKASVLVDSHG